MYLRIYKHSHVCHYPSHILLGRGNKNMHSSTYYVLYSYLKYFGITVKEEVIWGCELCVLM